MWLRLLYVGVEHAGATFIKLCQWASTRRDLFSKEFCDVFSGLNYKVRPHAWSHTVDVLKQAYGENWRQMLHLSDRQKPIGSGCIAQVNDVMIVVVVVDGIVVVVVVVDVVVFVVVIVVNVDVK